MARIRSIKPEFWVSEQVVECSLTARLLFIGMWSFCDDGGVHPASPKTLKMEVFPGDDISAAQVAELIDELISKGLIKSYVVDGKEYWRVTGWHHQKIEKPNFRYPDEDGRVPVADKSSNSRRAVADQSTPEGRGEEGSRVEGSGGEEGLAAPLPESADSAGLPACPHGEIIELYNSMLASQGLVAVNPKFWKGSKADALRARWREEVDRQNLDWWRGFFNHVANSDFLMGRTTGRDGKVFRPDLEWLVTFRNFANVCQGKYHG